MNNPNPIFAIESLESRQLLSAGVPDFNNDGYADLLIRNAATGQNQIWLMNGNGRRLAAVNIPSARNPWVLGDTVDADNDGDADILWRNAATGENRIWVMNGTTRERDRVLPSATNTDWRIAAAVENVNTGGWNIYWRNARTGHNAVWDMNFANRVQSYSISRVSDLDWQIVGVGDFVNTTGRPSRAIPDDILWVNRRTGDTAIWVMNGANYVANLTPPVHSEFGWFATGVKDMNSDGVADIVWQNLYYNDISVWEMDGQNIWDFQSLGHLYINDSWTLNGRQP